MNLFLPTTILIVSATTNAFISPCRNNRASPSETTTTLEVVRSSRRRVLEQAGGWMSVLLLGGNPVSASLLDESSFKDLLPPAGETVTPGKRPTYLKDPTEEFKVNEEKAMEFRRLQIKEKQKFTTVIERLINEPNDEAALIADLKELRSLVIANGGLPVGLKKEDMYKQIRAKKRKGYWPTDVEIAYQKLINEIIFQQSPNIEDKEGGMKFS